MARLARLGSVTLAALIAALVLLHALARAAESDKGVIADLISRALSSPSMMVSIGAVDGVLSSDASIRDIVLSDRNGPWLKVDKVRLIWSRLALLKRRLEVDRLTIDHMQVLRRPLPSESPPPPDNAAPQPILPELPLKVIVKQFAVQDLSIGEPVVGVAAQLSLAGKATLGPPSEGLDLHLTAKRLDAAGEFSTQLVFVPASNNLTLNLDFNEPAGGLFAHFANLPGLPPVRLAFDGSGPLDHFDAKLDFTAGADIWARGDVVVAGQNDGRRLTLDLNSRLEGLFPSVIRPVFAGDTTLKGAVLFKDDSSIALPGGLHLVSANARLDFEGGKSADNQLDLKLHAGAIPGATAIGKLDLNASIEGPLSGPRIEGAFDAGQIRVAEGSLDNVTATFRANPNGPLVDESTRISFEARGAMKGLHLAGPALARAIGSDATLNLRGSASSSGEATFDALELASPGFTAHYAGLLGRKKVHGRLDVQADDLSRFALIAGSSLKGEARIGADLYGAPRYGELTATLDARATNLATGYAILDRVTGGELRLTGAAKVLPGGGFGFSDLKASGAHGSARLNGDYAQDKVNIDAAIDVLQAQVLDPRIAGKAEVVASLSGAPSDLSAKLKASLGEGRLLDRKTSGLTLEARASHITDLVEANASLAGDVDGQPLQSSAHVAKRADGGWAIDNLGLTLASARLAGALTISAGGLANGELSFSATNLDDLSPLVLTKLSGSVQAKVTAAGASGRQSVSIAANSDRMSVGSNRFEGLNVDLTIDDVWDAKGVSGVASLSRAELAGVSISDVKLTAAGDADSSDLEFSGAVQGVALRARGKLFGGPPVRLDLASFTAERGGQRIALAGPAALVYQGGGLDIEHLAFAVDRGRISLAGHAGSTLDLRATAAGLPLAALDLAAPGLGLSGVADGEATLKGTPASPTGDWKIRLKQVTLAQMRNSAAPPLDIAGSGRLGGGRTTLDLTLNAGAGSAVRLTGSAPLSTDGALDVKIDGKLDAALANNSLSVAGRRLTGSLAIALQLRGTIAKPQASGSVRLVNGAFSDDVTGFKLTAINGLFVANGDAIRIDRLSGSTPNNGSIDASGEVKLDPAAGFPGSIRLNGKHAQLVSNDTVVATADLALTIAGRLGQKPNVDGRITILSMDITVPDRFNSVSGPIPGTKHLNPTPTARARLAQLARAKAARARSPLFDATLALTVSAANRIFVHGRGINAEVSGDLNVSGAAADPRVTGGFDLLRGSLSLLGKQLVFTRGRVQFHGAVMPDLDFVAETTAGDITARISVTGPAAEPVFAITSDPSLPQDEILARILFQKPSGSLSAFQALQLANAVATLTGRGDVFERLRKSFGLSSLNVGSSATGSPLLGLSRAINDRISVGVTTGARPQDNGVNVDLDVTRHIRLQAGVDATGGSSAGVGAEWEYK